MGFFNQKISEDSKDSEVVEDSEDEIDYYEATVTCDNCEETTEFSDIPCGTKVKDFIKDKKCHYCDCNLGEEE